MDVSFPKAFRLNIVLKALPSLLVGAFFLDALPLQVPGCEEFQVPVVGSGDPSMANQEALGLWGVQEDALVFLLSINGAIEAGDQSHKEQQQ